MRGKAWRTTRPKKSSSGPSSKKKGSAARRCCGGVPRQRSGSPLLGSARHGARARLALGLAAPPSKGTPGGMAALIKAAKKEGHLNTIALPPDWANYGEMMSTFPKKYGIRITNDNPERQLRRGEPGDRLAEGRLACPGRRRRRRRRSRSRAPNRACTRSTSTRTTRRSRAAMKDTRGFWMGDYWGAISIGYNASPHQQPAEDVEGPAEARVQGQGRPERQPARRRTRRSPASSRRRSRTAARSTNVRPGIDFFATLKKSGNFIPVQTTPQTVASGQTPISIDWDYNNLAYIKEFPAAQLEASRSRPTASTAATTRRRSTRRRRIRRRHVSGRSSSTPTRASSSG